MANYSLYSTSKHHWLERLCPPTWYISGGTLIASTINKLDHLIELNLEFNSLTTLEEDIFASLTQLDRLSLAGNILSHLPEKLFYPLSKLRWLRLKSNILETLPDQIFSHNPQVIDLTLNDTQLQALPISFLNLSHLKLLNLENTNLPKEWAKYYNKPSQIKQLFSKVFTE